MNIQFIVHSIADLNVKHSALFVHDLFLDTVLVIHGLQGGGFMKASVFFIEQSISRVPLFIFHFLEIIAIGELKFGRHCFPGMMTDCKK